MVAGACRELEYATSTDLLNLMMLSDVQFLVGNFNAFLREKDPDP